MKFLQRVIAQKERELAQKKAAASLDEVERRCRGATTRDFKDALSGRGRIIAEIKKRSPRVERFRQSDASNELAAHYERGGASAVSVVTDEANFGTSLSDAKRIREQISLPVLVKDFFIDPYQIVEARSFGADAVLLIARILTAGDLRSLHETSRQLGMSSLFEVHSENDIDKSIEAGAEIIGINNRDLDSLRVSLDTTRRLAGHVPSGIITVSESGVGERKHIEELSGLGVNAFLVGGALLESHDPEALLRSLLGKNALESDAI